MQSGSRNGNSDDARLAELAWRQHGTASAPQLRALGYSKHVIHDRMTAARWHRIHHTVYAIGHSRLSLRGRWMAAVLACGPSAVLSHRSAAALHDLCAVPGGDIDVTSTSRHALPGIRCHAVRRLDPRDVHVIDGIPVTTVDRVLLDQAEVLSRQRLRTLLEAAQRRDVLNPRGLRALIARSPGRRGIKPLRAALDELADEAPWTQSELERRFLELVRAAELPEPSVNVLVHGELVDFHWPRHRLVVEVDGYRFHRTRDRFEADRRRDAKLTIAGLAVIRVTHRRIADEAPALGAQLRALVSAGRARPAAASDR